MCCFTAKAHRCDNETGGARDAVIDHLEKHSTSGEHMPVRTRCPSLPAVEAIVGLKMPQHPSTTDVFRTIVVDYCHRAVMAQLLARGRNCVPCHRTGCRSVTTKLKGADGYTLRRAPFVVFSSNGQKSYLISARSSCATCKTHFEGLARETHLKSNPPLGAAAPKVDRSLYEFSHANPVTGRRMPLSVTSKIPIGVEYMNPNADVWLDDTMTCAIEHDLINQQTFADLARKYNEAMYARQSALKQCHEDETEGWWLSVNNLCGDDVWMGHSVAKQMALANVRAQFEFYGSAPDKTPPMRLSKRELDPGVVMSIHSEVMEMRRLALTAEFQQGVPSKNGDISLDHTFNMAGKINPGRGEQSAGTKAFATASHETGRCIGLRYVTTMTSTETAKMIEGIAKRPGYPLTDNTLSLVIDNVPPKTVGVSPSEKILLDAAGASQVMQDIWHVSNCFAENFSRHHPDYKQFAILGFRDASRQRDPVIERELDHAVCGGMVDVTRSYGGKKHVVVAWKDKEAVLKRKLQNECKGDILLRQEVTRELEALQASHVTVDELNQWKQTGLYHALFSTSSGNGVFVPYLARQAADAAASFARFEGELIASQCEQVLDIRIGDKVTFTPPKGKVLEATVVPASRGKTLAALLLDCKAPVQIAGNQSTTALKLDLLTFVDEDRLWRVADHVAMDRLEVREYCARFKFRLQKRVDKYDGAPLCPSIDNLLKDVANAALRVAKCRPPAGMPQHKRLVHRGTGELCRHKSGLPLHLQLHHACEGLHKRMQRIVRSDNLRQSTTASLLLAGVNGLNRLNDANAGVETCGHPLTHIEWDRKRRRLASPDTFGNVMPKELLNVRVPSLVDYERAKPENSPDDQVGLTITSRYDKDLGRHGRAGMRVNPDVAPRPVHTDPRLPQTALPWGCSPVGVVVQQSSSNCSAELESKLDDIAGRLDVARQAAFGGRNSEAAAVSARSDFARGLYTLSLKLMESWGAGTTDLPRLPPPPLPPPQSLGSPPHSAISNPGVMSSPSLPSSCGMMDSTPSLASSYDAGNTARTICIAGTETALLVDPTLPPAIEGVEGFSFVNFLSETTMSLGSYVGLSAAPPQPSPTNNKRKAVDGPVVDTDVLPPTNKRKSLVGPPGDNEPVFSAVPLPPLPSPRQAPAVSGHDFKGNHVGNWPCTCGHSKGAPNRGLRAGQLVGVKLKRHKPHKAESHLKGKIIKVDGINLDCTAGTVTVELDTATRGTSQHTVPSSDVYVQREKGNSSGSRKGCAADCMRKTQVTMPEVGLRVVVMGTDDRNGTLECDGRTNLGKRPNNLFMLCGFKWFDD